MDDSTSTDLEFKQPLPAAVSSQGDNNLMSVSSSSTSTLDGSSGPEDEIGSELMGTVEGVEDTFASEGIDEMPELSETLEYEKNVKMDGITGNDVLERFDAVNNDVSSQCDDILIAVSPTSLLTLDQSSGPGNEIDCYLTGTAETVAGASTNEDFEEMLKTIETPKCDKNVKMDEITEKVLEVERSDAVNDDVFSRCDDISIAVSPSSLPTLDQSSGPEDEICFEQTGTVEIVAEKYTSEDIKEMPELTVTAETVADKSTCEDIEPKLIVTQEPEKSRTNDESAGKDLELKSSDFFNDDVSSQCDDISMSVSSSSTVTFDLSSGSKNDGTDETVVETSTSENIDEMPKLIVTPEPEKNVNMDEITRNDLEVKRSDAVNNDVSAQCDDLPIAISSSSTLTIDRSSGVGNEIGFEQTGTVETIADRSASEEIEEMPELIVKVEIGIVETVADTCTCEDIQEMPEVTETVFVADKCTSEDIEEMPEVNETVENVADKSTCEDIEKLTELFVKFEIGAVETVADKCTSEDIEEMPELSETVEIVADKCTSEDIEEIPEVIETVETIVDKSTVENVADKSTGEDIEKLPELIVAVETGTVETVADKCTSEDIEEMPELLETVEIVADKCTGEDIEEMTEVIETVETVVYKSTGDIEEMPELIVAVETGTVESKSIGEDIEEMPKQVITQEPEKSKKSEESAGKDIEVNRFDNVNNDDPSSQCDDILFAASSSSGPTFDRSSGPENEICFEQMGTVETIADTSTSEDIEEMPNTIVTPETEKNMKMDEITGKDLQVKRSDAVNYDVSSQCDDLPIAVSSSSTLTFDRTSGPANDIGFEQTGTVDTVADRSTSEDIEEMTEIIEIVETGAVETVADKSTTEYIEEQPELVETIETGSVETVADTSTRDNIEEMPEMIVTVEIGAVETIVDQSTSEYIEEQPELVEIIETGPVEIVADNSTRDDVEEMPEMIVTVETGAAETVADKSTSEYIEEQPELIETIETRIVETVADISTHEAEMPEMIVTVETVADKSTREDIEEMPNLVVTQEPGNSRKNEESACKDLELDRSDSLINDDVLSQCDDILIAVSSSSAPTFDRSSGPGNEIGIEQTGTVETLHDKSTTGATEEMPKLLVTQEPENLRKNVKFNLRKSLAWDQAFFTSDGVLDADELSTMIEGGENGVKHQLSGIEEEVYRSMDSISTFESDNLSLDCLEAELFQDIRASIQKSNNSSNLNNSNIKLSSGKKVFQPKVSSSSKKVDLDSGKRLGARTKDNTSSIPQPKIINRLNLNATSATPKRASLSVNHAKKDQDTAKKAPVTQKGTQTRKPTTVQGSKVTGMIAPRRALPKPSVGSKLSSLGSSSALKTDSTRPSSSSSSCSSGTDVKVNFLRKKVDPKPARLPVRSVISKTPSTISMYNKQPPVKSSVSSSISSASSISDWSPDSKASSIDTTISCRSFDGDASLQSALSIQPTPRNSNQTGSLSRPAGQPTGLRMPSPKIGFFDGQGKTGARTPTGGVSSQSKLPNGPTSSNDVKFGKVPPPKTAATHANMKSNLQKAGTKPSQEQRVSKPKTKSCLGTSNVDKDSNNSANSALGVPCNDIQSAAEGLRIPFAVKNSELL